MSNYPHSPSFVPIPPNSPIPHAKNEVNAGYEGIRAHTSPPTWFRVYFSY